MLPKADLLSCDVWGLLACTRKMGGGLLHSFSLNGTDPTISVRMDLPYSGE